MKSAVAILKAIAQCPSMILPVTFRWCFRSVSACGLENRKSHWRAILKSSGGALQAGDHADESTFPTSGLHLHLTSIHRQIMLPRTYLISSWGT